LNQEAYRKLINGQSRGLGAVIGRFFLRVVSWGYAAAIALRNFLYSKKWLKTHRANAVVISIGNVTAGGTGKTPLVIWMYRFLQNKNVPCAILTRGYKATQDPRPKTQDQIDEPGILTESCPQAKVIVNPDRVEAAAEAVNKFGAKVLIMDDGFQHRRLARDLDIVTIDATLPFGYGKMLPAGLLREPVTSLKRADVAVLTRCDQISDFELGRIENKLRIINSDMIIAKSIHAPVCAKSISNKKISLEELKNKKIFAFCGIGNPDAFLHTVKKLGVILVGSKVYNDHHHYTDICLAEICEQARNLKTDLILTTEKDWTKIASLNADKRAVPFAYLAIELKFLTGEDKLKQLIEDSLAGKIPS
jgi:tetraacyldisaccharide 4'-kinase